MDGRINRDTLTQTTKRTEYERSYRTARSGKSPDYRRRQNADQKKGFLNGKEHIFVQLIASGFMLLIVIVITRIPSEPARDAEQIIKDAISYNISFEEAVFAVDSIKNRVLSVVDAGTYEDEDYALPEDEAGGIIIDPDMLRELTEQADQKN